MYYANVRNILLAIYQMVAQWVCLDQANKELYMPLIDATYVLMNEVCILLRVDFEYVLDVWEKAEFKPEVAADKIIADRFERVEEE